MTVLVPPELCSRVDVPVVPSDPVPQTTRARLSERAHRGLVCLSYLPKPRHNLQAAHWRVGPAAFQTDGMYSAPSVSPASWRLTETGIGAPCLLARLAWLGLLRARKTRHVASWLCRIPAHAAMQCIVLP